MFSYADDSTLVVISESVDEAINIANQDLHKLNLWFNQNRIQINYQKSHIMLLQAPQSKFSIPHQSIKFNGTSLPIVKAEPLLGLQIQASMSWNYHIDKICLKLSFINSILFKLKMASVPTKFIITVYKTLLLPYINYCCTVWGFTTKNNIKKTAGTTK